MGFESTLENISAYLDEGYQAKQINGLAKIFPFAPTITNEGVFTLPSDDPGHKMGTVVYLHLNRVGRARVSLGGQNSGIKKVRYILTMLGFTRAASRLSQTVGVQSQQLFDSLTAYVEANRIANSASSPNPIFQWGEGETLGADDLPIVATLPRTIRQGVKQVFWTMEVVVLEFVYA